RRHSVSTLFPYTTLFRSRKGDEAGAASTLPVRRRHRPLATSAARQRAPDESTPRKLPGKSSDCAANPCDENARNRDRPGTPRFVDRKSTRLNSSHVAISY